MTEQTSTRDLVDTIKTASDPSMALEAANQLVEQAREAARSAQPRNGNNAAQNGASTKPNSQ